MTPSVLLSPLASRCSLVPAATTPAMPGTLISAPESPAGRADPAAASAATAELDITATASVSRSPRMMLSRHTQGEITIAVPYGGT